MAEVWTGEVRLVNAVMVEVGLAYVYGRYLEGCPSRGAILRSLAKPIEVIHFARIHARGVPNSTT